ncbi:MAG: adenylyltransferase/cytidyltransferase family protein [Pseudomonadota bacterium]
MSDNVIGGTIGVFDLLHVGHVRFLETARAQCQQLKVGVGSDRAVGNSKGRQPVINQAQRRELLAALRCVDDTCIFDVGLDNTQASVDWIVAWGIKKVFVGDDWAGSGRWLRLQPLLAERGIQCVWLPYSQGISTTVIRQIICMSQPAGD